jgi:PAS domain S-box-containing protein
VPVVYLTAYADEGTLDRAKLTEPFGYLVKPFSEVELRTTIEVALYKHRQDMKTRDAAHWFSSAINILGAALMVTDQDGNVKHMNHVAEALTGWSQQEAEGRHFAEVFVIRDPETGEIMENPASMPLTVGFMSGSSRNVLISRKETEIDVENALLPITDSEGRFSGVIIAFQEVTSHDPEDQEWFNHAANLYLLATLSCSEGEFSKAESLYKRTLLLFERHLGTDHPKVTNIINDLEDLYRKTGRKTEADQLKKRVSGLRRGASSGIWAVPHDES